MRRVYSASDKRRYTNKEIAKPLEIAYDALKIIQQQVWCEHDKS